MNRPKGLYILDGPSTDLIYGRQERADIDALMDIIAAPQTRESVSSEPAALAEAEIIFSGWGGPVMDSAFLAAAPKLRAFFYGAGSIRPYVTDAFWDRNIVITSAYAANAVPVSEYTLGAILLSLKNFWNFAAEAKHGRGWGDHKRTVPGAFNATVGLVSFGMIARMVCRHLRNFDLRCIVYDPFLSAADASAAGVEKCSLEEVFARADVVSLHTPQIPETEGMIRREHFAAMKTNATFINTARGAVVREREMIEVLRQRPDLSAVLDVCDPEPPQPDCGLFALPNVVMTPHIAGSMGPEIQRMGRYMVEELRRYMAGEPLRWQITREMAAKLA